MSAAAGPGIVLSGDVKEADLARAMFFTELLADGVRLVHVTAWATQAARPAGMDAEVQLVVEGLGWYSAMLRLHGCLVHLILGEGRVTVRVAHRNEHQLASALAALRSAIPEATVDDRTIPVTFWTWAETHSNDVTRQLEVPSWRDVRGNYSARTRAAIENVLHGFTPGKAGQLILWTGEPGTGKTWAIRALAWEWQRWCRLHYIADPEQLLGQRSRYLLDVLLAEEEATEETGSEPIWRLLLLEDTGEMLSADAKERAGQGLSRLLNVVDGLIGQGLRILVMITTNDRVGTLHPALARAGRCALAHEFDRLPVEEANAWLAARGATAPVTRATTIADLYAMLDGRAAAQTRILGFDGNARTALSTAQQSDDRGD